MVGRGPLVARARKTWELATSSSREHGLQAAIPGPTKFLAYHPAVPRLRAFVLVAILTGPAMLGGCKGTQPPYAKGDEPAVEELLAATEPPLQSIQVPRAKVRQGGGPAANLMLLAESPTRFAGTIQVSGQELVSLAVNEEEYGLRWIGSRSVEGLTPGYYSGPPSRCAVEALLGVDLEPEAFVSLVLGGAPVIDPPHQVIDRGWDRKQGWELLTITNGEYEQRLGFAWIDGGWHFASSTLWRITGGERRWLWTVRHESLRRVGGEVLPEKTEIRQPKPRGRGDLVLHVTYERQVANPSFGDELDSDPPRDDEPANAGDQWADDDGGWEDEDDWEDAEADDSGAESPANASPDAPTSEAAAPASEPAEPEPTPEPAPIPDRFRGNPTGLKLRGDLCAGRH